MGYVLVAEDNKAIREGLVMMLKSSKTDYSIVAVSDGEQAINQVKKLTPELVILDIMMPKKNGYEVLDFIRSRNTLLPVIFLTAKSTPQDIVLGLSLGADDYIVKPFKIAEVIARVNAALRRERLTNEMLSNGTAAYQLKEGEFKFGATVVNTINCSLRHPDGEIDLLTDREVSILKMLVENDGSIVSRSELFDKLWKMEYFGQTHTLDVALSTLRKKLRDESFHIRTISGRGYKYVK